LVLVLHFYFYLNNMKLIIAFLLMTNPVVLFDFNLKSSTNQWKIVDDVVMGGSSSSQFFIDESGNGVFQGTVSTENNGGFCSMQHYFEPVLLGGKKVFCIRLKGDGKQYQFRVKSKRSNSYSYIYEFQTTNEWQTIEIPFSQMYASFRGRTLDLPNFNGVSLEEMAFLIGNKKEENFQIKIDKIEVK
jgi:NADH dehydrogenase [ubiquinone] 1 alpha subcomplex assembly factor 1